MTTIAVALAEIAALKARVDALEGSGARPSSSDGGPHGGGEALSDSQLDNAWANKRIAKDPPRWRGATQVGRTYSEATVAWLESMAGFLDWKAQKGREELPVRMNNKGRPWHESDAFEAKILRGWARRNAAHPADSPKAEEANPSVAGDAFGFGADSDDGGIPF